MNYEDVKVNAVVYFNQHEVYITEKGYHDNHEPYVLYTYVNPHQPTMRGVHHTSPTNLRKDPLHCWNCESTIVDRLELDVCSHCSRTFCPTCTLCHCDTPWDRRKSKRK